MIFTLTEPEPDLFGSDGLYIQRHLVDNDLRLSSREIQIPGKTAIPVGLSLSDGIDIGRHHPRVRDPVSPDFQMKGLTD